MSQPKTVSVPATAESVGDILYIWDDGDRVQLDDHHYRILYDYDQVFRPISA